MIDNKFLFYKTLDSFKIDLQDGLISRESIAFIKQPTVIWTHNTYYNCTGYPGDEYLSWYNDGHADKDTRKNSSICWKYNGNEVNTVSIDITNDDFVMTLDNPYNLTPVEITITGTEGVINIENNTVKLIQDQSLRISGTVIVTAKFDGNDEYKPSTIYCEVVVNKVQYTEFGWNKTSNEVVMGQEVGHIFPELNNILGFENITYSSSNTNVATINESGNTINIVGEGTTNICASFGGNNLYESKDAIYLLTVRDSVVSIEWINGSIVPTIIQPGETAALTKGSVIAHYSSSRQVDVTNNAVFIATKGSISENIYTAPNNYNGEVVISVQYNGITSNTTLTVTIETLFAYIGAGTNVQSVVQNNNNKISDYTGQKTYNIQVQSGDNIWIIVPDGVTYSAYMGGQPMGLATLSGGTTIDGKQYDVKSTISFSTASTKSFVLNYN